MQNRRVFSNAILAVFMAVAMILSMGMYTQSFAGIWDYNTGIEDASATGNVITVTFERAVKLKAAESELFGENGKIYIDNWGSRVHNFSSSDTINISGKTMTITMNDGYQVPNGVRIHVSPGTVQTEDGTEITADNAWSISVKPSISSFSVAPSSTIDAAGGEVTVSMNGTNLNKANNIVAVLRDTTGNKVNIPVTVKYGSTPTATFTLPENTSDNSVSYRFSVDTIDGTVQYTQGPTITQLGKGQKSDEVTLNSMTINGKTSEVDHPVNGNQKFYVQLNGTNLDPDKIELRAIDENGIVWPVYHYSDCNGTIRFNSTFRPSGGGNAATVEVMLPRTLGVEHTYTIQASLSGKGSLKDPLNTINNPYDSELAKSFLENPSCTIRFEAGTQEECTNDDVDNVKTVHVKYVDENGKEIAKEETYKGYGVTMLNQFNIQAKDIDGYKLKSSPDESLLQGSVINGFIRDLADQNYTLTYTYASDGTKPTDPTQPTDPTKPTDPTQPVDPTKPADPGLKPVNPANPGASTITRVTVTKNAANVAPKTGDTQDMVLPAVVLLVAASTLAGTVYIRRRHN